MKYNIAANTNKKRARGHVFADYISKQCSSKKSKSKSKNDIFHMIQSKYDFKYAKCFHICKINIKKSHRNGKYKWRIMVNTKSGKARRSALGTQAHLQSCIILDN